MTKKNPNSEPNCSRCNGHGLVVEPDGNWARASICDCSRSCPKCNSQHWNFKTDELGREFATPCQCALVHKAVVHYNHARVPAKYAEACLNSKFKDEGNQEAFSTLKLLVKEYHDRHKGILLTGLSGVGKTWLVAAFIHEFIVQRGLPVIFRDFFHLLSDLKAGYSHGTSDGELIQPLVDAKILVIDELGKGRNTKWEQDILDTVISQRYNASSMCVFTTNYAITHGQTISERIKPPGTIAEAEPIEIRETLAERVGPRVYSRLQEMCYFLHINCPDRRELPPS